MQAGGRLVGRARGQVVLGQQVPDHVVVGAEAAQQHVARGQLHDLRGRQRGDQVGRFLRDAQVEQRLRLVLADQALGQHEVGEIGFPDLRQHLFARHLIPFKDRNPVVR